ncbi:MAG TPA: hypothetical protein VIQ51_03775, partial [Chryseosolibacter sp.]
KQGGAVCLLKLREYRIASTGPCGMPRLQKGRMGGSDQDFADSVRDDNDIMLRSRFLVRATKVPHL